MDAIQLLERHGYWTVFFGLLLEYLGLPIPGELILFLFGALISRGELGFWPVLATALAAVLLGDHFWYFAGRRGGEKWLRLFCRATLGSARCMTRTEKFYRKYGPASLVFSKFLPGFRAFSIPMAGMTGINYEPFLFFAGMGSVLWVGGTMALGMLMAPRLEVMAARIENFGGMLFLSFVVITVVVLAVRLRSRLRYGEPRAESRLQQR